ncbi:MAG: recombinase family protein [Pseudomonadota bacterium]
MPTAYLYTRFSSNEQEHGDSSRRQLEAAKRYVAENDGLSLDTSYIDKGVSAYRGKNFNEGALGRFLADYESGRVPPDSLLLVEQLDRLSRDNPLNAMLRLLGMLTSGLTVVSLNDMQVYAGSGSSAITLMRSLMDFETANLESKKKSERIAAVWGAKQDEARATGKPTTARCPQWLRLSGDSSRYEPIPDRVKVVQSIFQMSAEGLGRRRIADRLNDEGVPAFGHAAGWGTSSIGKLLSNRAVLGEYQPTNLVDGSRTAVKPPVVGFYPTIIEPALFDAVHQSQQSRRISGRGRKGKSFSNLLTGLATCARCGAPLNYTDKRPARERVPGYDGPRKGHRYLRCSMAGRNPHFGCDSTGFRYDIVERAFLSSLSELDFVDIINRSRPEQRDQLDRVAAQVASAERSLSSAKSELKNLMVAARQGATGDTFNSELDAAEAQRTASEARLEDLQRLQKDLQRASERAKETASDFQSAYSAMLSERDPDVLYGIRARINARLKELVERLEIIPWRQDPDISAQMFPEGPPEEFYRHRRQTSVLFLTYCLRDESLRIRGRFQIINTHRMEVFEGTEEVPEGVEGFYDTPEDARAVLEEHGEYGAVGSFLRTGDYAGAFTKDTRLWKL